MLFLIKNDIKYIFLKRKKWIIFYFMIMMLFPIFCKMNEVGLDEIFLINVGLKFSDNAFIFVLIYLFNLAFYIFICLDLYFGNLKIGIDNIFLRLNKMKIIISKMIATFLIILFFTSATFLLLPLIYSFLGLHIHDIIVSFIILNLYRMLLAMLIMILIACALCQYYWILIFLVPFSLFGYWMPNVAICFIQPYLAKDCISYFAFGFILILIVYLYILRKAIIKIFERSF